MSALADELGKLGARVFYCADEITLEDRKNLGWVVPHFQSAKLVRIASEAHASEICREASNDAIHLCQGIRGNGYVSKVQAILRRSNQSYWIMMETVDERGMLGKIKSLVYRFLFFKQKGNLEGVLAIGETTRDWVSSKAPFARVFPFAYFPERYQEISNGISRHTPERGISLVFVGQLIPRKNLVLLFQAMQQFGNDLRLTVIGSGVDEDALKCIAKKTLDGRVAWMGSKKQSEIPSMVSMADALILPSLHDGWGAVVSEAIAVGTPTICSDKCGASELSRLAPGCGVFVSANIGSLSKSLMELQKRGRWKKAQRSELIKWADRISPEAGARYLLDILNSKHTNHVPTPPWQESTRSRCE